MECAQKLSGTGKLALSITALALLVGSGIAYAAAQKVFTSSYEFQVVNPAEPIIDTSVKGTFVSQSINIFISMSSQEHVRQLNGTVSVIVQIWNDTSGSYVNFQTLASNKAVSLTPTPTVLSYVFTTDTPGTYNVYVEFTATSVETA